MSSALPPLVSKGPLAAWRIVPRRLHLYVDLLLAGCFALSPLVYLPGLPVIPIVISEAVAFVLVRMSLTTEIVPASAPRKFRKGHLGAKGGEAGGFEAPGRQQRRVPVAKPRPVHG